MSDPETLATYARHAQSYAALTDAGLRSDPILAAFIARMPKGGHALDLGCGPGTAAALMARAGLTVEATDAVPEMVALAAKQPGVQARLARFDQITETARYDGIWANFSLLHAPRADLPTILRALHRALKPPGHLHVAMKLGTDTARDTLGRQYTYVTEAELRHLLTTAGFTPTQKHTGRDKGLDGTYADWIALAADG